DRMLRSGRLVSPCSLLLHHPPTLSCFFFTTPAPTETYTLSLHDALPISPRGPALECRRGRASAPSRPSSDTPASRVAGVSDDGRSEEHTSELQSLAYLVCRLLLEKKKKIKHPNK